jgi:hypothetical protein
MSVARLISEGKYTDANRIIHEALDAILEQKLIEVKKIIMASEATNIDEAARFKIVKVRIRKGKIQRRKKVSNASNTKIQGGKVVRMTTQERLHRKRGARIGKVKRRRKLAQIKVKMKRANRKRKALGL